MNERVKKVITTTKEKWNGFSLRGRILIVTIPLVVIIAAIILTVVLNQKSNSVLFTGIESAEAGKIVTAIQELGVTDVTLNNNGDIVVPEDQVDYLRMQMYIQGYPSSSLDDDLYKSSVDLFSTESDKEEIKRQQRQARIEATLETLTPVKKAIVILTPPSIHNYVINSNQQEASASIVLHLNDGATLTDAQIRGVYNSVLKSVSVITIDNISVVDGDGNPLKWIDEDAENAKDDMTNAELDIAIAFKRTEFQQQLQKILYDNLSTMFDKMYGSENYAINVTAWLNYDEKYTESTEYTPSYDQSGMIDHEIHITEGTNLDEDGGLVGVTPDADSSPDYPTYIGTEDGQVYYYDKDEIQYDVNNAKTQLRKDGYSIDSLSVSLVVNETNMTEAEREALQNVVAKAAGTTLDNVAVHNMVFALPDSDVGSSSRPIVVSESDTMKNVLLYIVVGLGLLLILLLILSLFVSSSRKKKARRSAELAHATASAAISDSIESAEPKQTEVNEVDFNLASLTEEANKESKETLLKKEISDFSRTSPDIVASIIRNMLNQDSEK